MRFLFCAHDASGVISDFITRDEWREYKIEREVYNCVECIYVFAAPRTIIIAAGQFATSDERAHRVYYTFFVLLSLSHSLRRCNFAAACSDFLLFFFFVIRGDLNVRY